MNFQDFVSHLTPWHVVPDEGARAAEAEGYATSVDIPVDLIDDAEVISSLHRESVQPDVRRFFDDGSRHDVVLDIDVPAMLIPSTTEGHSHLIVRLPNGGAKIDDYQQFLWSAAKIGLIEEGYAKVSCKRDRTDVRLPWIRKGGPGEPSFIDTRVSLD